MTLVHVVATSNGAAGAHTRKTQLETRIEARHAVRTRRRTLCRTLQSLYRRDSGNLSEGASDEFREHNPRCGTQRVESFRPDHLSERGKRPPQLASDDDNDVPQLLAGFGVPMRLDHLLQWKASVDDGA